MTFPPNTVHLWVADFDQLAPQYDHFLTLLSTDEVARMTRFISEDVQRRFGLARGMLRTVLARYVGDDADALRFDYGERGKPSLIGSDVQFNLSHSANKVIIGLIRHRHIGVDVEQVSPLPAMATMAHDNFSAHEFKTLYDLPEAERLPSFYRCWTRKEAYIKAVGDGFALPLQDFDVTLKADDAPKFLRIKDGSPADWSLLHLDLGDSYIGAVCVAGDKTPRLEMHSFK